MSFSALVSINIPIPPWMRCLLLRHAEVVISVDLSSWNILWSTIPSICMSLCLVNSASICLLFGKRIVLMFITTVFSFYLHLSSLTFWFLFSKLSLSSGCKGQFIIKSPDWKRHSNLIVCYCDIFWVSTLFGFNCMVWVSDAVYGSGRNYYSVYFTNNLLSI